MGNNNQDTLFSTFPLLASKSDLCRFLGVTPGKLNFLLYKLTPADRYKTQTIKKRNGEDRKLRVPVPLLKKIQKIIATELAKEYRPRQHVYGYVKGKNIVQKARVHVAQKWVARVDLKDFFPSVNFGRVFGIFQGHPFHFGNELATVLTQLVMDGNELPQGAPTSPIISNFICRSLDFELKQMAKEHRCFYTRYADDLVFSTNLKRLSPQICSPVAPEGVSIQANVGDGLRGLIERQGFKVNDIKTRIFDRSSRQQVTGITVNEKVNISREYVRGLRALCEEALFLVATHWILLRPSLRWRCRPAVIIAMCDEVAEQHVPLFPWKPVFCQWNFLDPLATKAGDDNREWTFEHVFRKTLRRVSVFVALLLHSRKAATRLLVVNAIAETASVSIAID